MVVGLHAVTRFVLGHGFGRPNMQHGRPNFRVLCKYLHHQIGVEHLLELFFLAFDALKVSYICFTSSVGDTRMMKK